MRSVIKPQSIQLLMFHWLKPDPAKKLRRQYDAKLEQAILAQRSGNSRLLAGLTVESEALWLQPAVLMTAEKIK